MGLYQVSSNDCPGVKFDLISDGSQVLHGIDYIGKTLEISLYLATRPRLSTFCM